MSLSARPQFKSIDTLSIAKRLIAAGLDSKIAEEHAEIFDDIASYNLATKQDILGTHQKIKETESCLQAKIKETESRLEVKIAETKVELIKWMVGMFFTQTLVIIGSVIAILKAFLL